MKHGVKGENRTRMRFLPEDFKSSVSAGSTTLTRIMPDQARKSCTVWHDWCRRGDSNSHAFAADFESAVSTCSTTPAWYLRRDSNSRPSDSYSDAPPSKLRKYKIWCGR